MDETTRSLLESITHEYPTPREIPGGHLSKFHYDCMSLSPNDLARLAAQATGHLAEHEFDMTVGVAYTGILFAAAVAGGRQVGIIRGDRTLTGPSIKGKRVVLVDDIICTGTRLREAASITRSHGGIIVGFAVIIDRTGGEGQFDGVPVWSAAQLPL